MADNPRRDRRQIDPDEKQFDERVLNIDRVARVVKGGRRFHFRALVAVGDHAGKIGIGVDKGIDVTSAVNKAVGVAKKNMVDINLYNETIPHDTESKVSGAHILIKPAAPGTGLIAGGVVRVVLEVTGIRNALSKSLGSNNKINAAYATLSALKLMEPASNWVTRSHRATNVPKATAVEKPKETTEAATKPKPATVKKSVKKVSKPAKATKTTKKVSAE